VPNRLILPMIRDELSHVAPENIILFNALGTHRHSSAEELAEMLGEDICRRYRIVQNNAFDRSTQISLGQSARGHEIWLNRQLVECDVKILTGFIEPHFFAGFSGGAKAIMPGMAGELTVLGNHDAGMIAHPNATWGVTAGNPIYEEIVEIGTRLPRTFLVNVALNKRKEITGVFSGHLSKAHAVGCAFVKRQAMAPVPDRYDIVVTTNSGYPLDLNLYQAVKGMSAAAQVVRQGGAIVIAAECQDGVPEHGLYGQLLREAPSPESLLEAIHAPGFLKQDQWQVQIQAQVLLRADVYVYSEYLTAEEITGALLKPCLDIRETLEKLMDEMGGRARICLLPEGPQTIPYVSTAQPHLVRR
jgi:nickel-dependent lactate racemase